MPGGLPDRLLLTIASTWIELRVGLCLFPVYTMVRVIGVSAEDAHAKTYSCFSTSSCIGDGKGKHLLWNDVKGESR